MNKRPKINSYIEMRSRNKERNSNSYPQLSHIGVRVLKQNTIEICENDINRSNYETTNPIKGKDIAIVVIRVDSEENPHGKEYPKENKERRFSQQEIKR